MLKAFLTSFGTKRSLLGLPEKGANHLVGIRVEATNRTVIRRNYVKSRGGTDSEGVEINENELAKAFDIEELKEDFSGPVEHFKAQLRGQTQYKPARQSIGNIQFELEGKTYRIKDLAQVGKKSATIYVLHFDGAPTAIPAALKAMVSANSKWTFEQEGTKIHVEMPKVENDKKYIQRKQCKTDLNLCKEELAMVQNKYMRKLNKHEELDLEMKLNIEDQLQGLTKELSIEAERHLQEKLRELQKEVD